MKQFPTKDLLTDLCLNVRNHSNAIQGYKHTPERVEWICGVLDKMGVEYHVDLIAHRGLKLYNVIVSPVVIGNHDSSIILTAHHDVANVHSQNCNDNSASVVNLLHICQLLKDKTNVGVDVRIAFTDCEEFGGLGAHHLSYDTSRGFYGKVIKIINLELSGAGTEIWMAGREEWNHHNTIKLVEDSKLFEEARMIHCPFNDSVIFREWDIDSICVGILPKIHKRAVSSWMSGTIFDGLDRGLWMNTHSERDTIYTANFSEMDIFVKKLLSMCYRIGKEMNHDVQIPRAAQRSINEKPVSG